MATNYPDGLDSFVNPTGTDALSSPAHATQHANVNDAVEAIEATLGLNPEGTYTDVSDRLDALVTDAAAAASAYNDSAQAAMGSAISAAGSAQSYSVDSYSYSQFASTDADLASAAAGSAVASASAAAASASSAASSAATVDATATTATEFRQFAADGSVLANLPARVHPAEQLLKQAVWWIDAAHSSASGQTVSNLGWGGSALDAQLGSTGSADSNDPKHLDWQGENYIYLPGVAGNYLSVPDEAALDITGDIDIRAKVDLDSWNNGAFQRFVAKFNSSGNYSFTFGLQSGNMNLAWSNNGSAVLNSTSSVTVSGTPGVPLWCRVTLDVDNGAAGNTTTFYTSTDGVTWAQLGSTVVKAGTTNIFSGSNSVLVGAAYGGAAELTAGRIHRAQILNGIDGTPVLDVDCSQITSGSDTSFTALTGQTVTINRSTSGRKTVGVVSPRWLLGTDDYMEVADNDLLDFGTSDSGTWMFVGRVWNTPNNSQFYLDKRGSSGGGYTLRASGTSLSTYNIVSDGTNSGAGVGPTLTEGGASVLASVFDRSGGYQTVYLNATPDTTPESIASVGSISSSNSLRVGGRTTGGYHADLELTAAAIWRRSLTAGEIATLNSYYQGRG